MSSPGSLAVRLALLAVALAAIVAIASWQRTEDDCNEAGATVVRGVGGAATPAQVADARSTLLDGCHASEPLMAAGGVLQRDGQERQAEPLVRRVLRDEPDNFGAWATLSLVLAESDPAGAERARERALELNPLAGR